MVSLSNTHSPEQISSREKKENQKLVPLRNRFEKIIVLVKRAPKCSLMLMCITLFSADKFRFSHLRVLEIYFMKAEKKLNHVVYHKRHGVLYLNPL